MYKDPTGDVPSVVLRQMQTNKDRDLDTDRQIKVDKSRI